MNKRIRELAEQVELNATLLFNKDKLEKFAELIVRECADLVKDFYQEDEFTCYSAKTEIKEHFGVEE